MEIILAVAAFAVSVVALISNFMTNRHESVSFKDQVYDRFAQMWFDMDQIFIDHPQMHKYFYRNHITGKYAELSEDHDDFELGLCISEMFSDVFQYSEPLEQYLTKEDRASYRDYKKMIMDALIVKKSKEVHSWHES